MQDDQFLLFPQFAKGRKARCECELVVERDQVRFLERQTRLAGTR